MNKLENKVAVITGGSGGLGVAASKLFVEEGAKVVIVDINEDALKTAVKDINHENISYVVSDVTQPEQVQNFVNITVERHGKIDVFLANAGIEGKMDEIINTPIEMFDQVIAVNVRGVWLGLKYVMPVMAKNGGGSIVITSSTAGIRGSFGMSPYSTSKHAVIGLMRSAALEGASMGIRVNTVNPGPNQTRMMRSIEQMTTELNPTMSSPKDVEKSLSERAALKRYGEPHEVAQMMLFLSSEDSSYCNGGVYMVDGGTSAGSAHTRS